MSLRYKIISLFILAIILPALFLSVVISSISKKSIRKSIYSQQYEILNRVADRINSQIDKHQQLLTLHKNISRLSIKEQINTAQEILFQGPAFTEITMLDNKGRERWKFSKTGKTSSLVNRAKREEFIKGMSGNYISQVNFSGERMPYIFFSCPLYSRSGVLVAKLDLSQMWEWIKEIKIGDSGFAFVVDKKGNLIAHKDSERVLAHSNFSNLKVVKDFIENTSETTETWNEYKGESGIRMVSMYRVLEKLNWAVITQIPKTEVYKPIKKMYSNILFWTFVWTFVFLIIGFKFVNHILEPLSQLRAGAEKISQGKLDIKFNITTKDEVEELAKDFEKMAVALKDLEEMKQDLTRMIIHDLKGPLSGIMGGLEYLESGMMGEISDGQKNILAISKKSSENLLTMIQNLLDIAKMEEGKLDLQLEEADLQKIIIERKNQYDALATREEKSISTEIEEGMPLIKIDKNLIERVLNNLISNAIHHTTSNGKITLGLKKNEKSVFLSVQDNGSGIPEEYKEKIFEKFVQIKRQQENLRTGVGLGLTFCKMAVESHGGKIKVESELNKGSKFILEIPLKQLTAGK